MGNLIRLSSATAHSVPGDSENVGFTAPEDTTNDQGKMMLDQLDRQERLRLVRFVCSFAWADFEIRPEERTFISRLIRRLDLGDEDDLQVQHWLERPPAFEDLDPTVIPAAHRELFVEAIEGLIVSDGEIAEEERETFEVFKQLIAS
jgi:uncharacterized tellurite resistance protein B-like protein